ncbi:MAG: NifB/NifX family molybdenum-iron cluster-binding protein [Verrucomicrobia bacterium]|jgi:predicted Fe-Mo cluster-binding NifX family protein|nr:NifB/NifX family molybdenum-iron cluster-binding protein [Verrucomicrobiota bacterium]OQC65500.1 MAG: Dinitrogenase iron-molybdenum cofactor [Verrucomicrobia bacterium ADurb.Bin006]MDI9381877.1 NifB/NifX family molybdenum-iron cluster-binding protein [Verrucomicrobiota bacterium]NMD20493.1 dinitrogenase iron-molybdenum cofactor biosynthesis protein [Verrucomicrobiota bacterium]HOA61047.1 NifB/NifX family molybdenum-iron cluster-binding protein [Verrucomicrobiota bacterium]
MKIAISTQGPQPNSALEPRFGRARYFRIVDTETGQQTVVDNENAAGAVQGAGPRAVQMLARLGVQAVLTGHVGPKAWTALESSKIQAYAVDGGSIEQSVRALLAGQLRAMSCAETEGHG